MTESPTEAPAMPGCLPTIAKVGLLLGGLLLFFLSGAFLTGFFFDTVGPYLADNPASQRPLGYAVGLVAALPLLVLAVRRPSFVVGCVLFGAYVWMAIPAAVLGLAAANRKTNELGRENLASWRQDAGDFRPALLQAFLGLSVLGLVLLYRRTKRDPRPVRRPA